MALPPGSLLGPYEITALLGAGGMGEVYKARDTRLDRDVAIKILSGELVEKPESLRRFEREARVASSLKHPNIVTIYDIGQSAYGPYIAMELVDGQTLHVRLARGRVPIDEVLALARQTAEAIAAAHEAGIVHRDLKPQNIMVARDGTVKVLDFGLGKLAPAVPGSASDSAATTAADSVTMPGRILGTTGYMSPEQIKGAPADARSDQFVFGLVLYELLTNTRAFSKDTLVQTLSAIIEDEPQPIEALNPKVPPRLSAIVHRCLRKSPDARYGSTRDLVRDLEEVQLGLKTGALSLPRWRPTRAARRWSAAVAGALVMVALVMWYARRPVGPAESRAATQLVVLPFVNVGTDPANQALSDGLVELLTTNLTQLERFQRSLMVVPASEVRRERIASAREARQTFGATLVVSGSVQRSDDRVRLTINLVDPLTLRQMKARSMTGSMGEIARLQDEAIAEVTGLLDVELDSGARTALARRTPAVPDAYAFYVQGRGYLQRFEDPANIDRAIDVFTRALRLDPRYALAHAAIAEAYWRKYEATKDSTWIARARAEGDEAVQLDEGLAQAHVTLGIIARGTGRYEDALAHLERAVAIDASGEAYRELAQAYTALGRQGDAETTYKRAIQVRPNDWSMYSALGAFYSSRSRYEDAASQFKRVIELTPDNARGYSNLGAVYFLLKQYDAAAATLERSVAIRPSAAGYSNLGTLYFGQKQYADAARRFERALEINPSDYRVWRNLAVTYVWGLHDGAKGRTAFEKAAALAEQELRVNPRQATVIAHLAECSAMTDRAARARALARQALDLAPSDANVLFSVGSVYEELGDRKQAFEILGRALAAGYPLARLESDATLYELRRDPAYRQLVRRAGADRNR